jgi:capsular polysaccharide biosynthesis protein
MELNEAARRIVGQHWRLIAACVIGGIIAAALVHAGTTKSYTATARLVLDTQDPKSRAESMAIADTGRAIATSPSQVAAALKSAGVTNRDPIMVGKKHVSVTALGTSAILQLSVSDHSARTAAAIANALAQRVIQTRLDASNGRAAQTRLDLERRIADLSRRIPSAAVDTRQVLLQQRGALESELVAVLAANSTHPEALVISSADVPSHPDSSKIVMDGVLGGILGLIVGLGLAGLAEVLRPTIVGGSAIADALGTIHLGALPKEHARVLTGMNLAARAVDVRDIGLIPVGKGHGLDIAGIAGHLEALEHAAHRTEEWVSPARAAAATQAGADERRLAATLEGRRPAVTEARKRARSTMNAPNLQIRPYSLNGVSSNGSSRSKAPATGLILVTRHAVMKSSLDEASQLVPITGIPVLGLITIKSPGAVKSPGRRTPDARSESVPEAIAKADR